MSRDSEKYPRMAHLPWSPGGTRDDRRLTSVEPLLCRPLIVSEKLDGSNACFSRDSLFARYTFDDGKVDRVPPNKPPTNEHYCAYLAALKAFNI